MKVRSKKQFWELGLHSIEELETDQGILASGRNEVYGCIFGRDSLITALQLLTVYSQTKDQYFLQLVKKILGNLAQLQGREVNIESGEEPGKMIHEFRPERHEHLTQHAPEGEMAWYLYADGIMRNYDSIDATPLFLMALHEYLQASNDEEFISAHMTHIRLALGWILTSGDANGDGFIDYHFNPARKYGGLKTQSWMDSSESVFFENYLEKPVYPIAPVEAQAYAYAALRGWAAYFEIHDKSFATELSHRADALKERFNQSFVLHGPRRVSLAYAIDGNGRPLTSARSSMGHVLWAVYKKQDGALPDGNLAFPDCILEQQYVPAIVARLLSADLYVKRAGIRTLSSKSKKFGPNSYHNGSIWPHDTSIVAQGLENFGYKSEARAIRKSLLKAYAHFDTPIELFTFSNKKIGEYVDAAGHGACRTQAWSAASLLTMFEGEDVKPMAQNQLQEGV